MATFKFLSHFLTFLLIPSYINTFGSVSATQVPRRALLPSVQQQFLTPHNQIRAGLGLPPLKWSKKLANYASWYANQRKEDCALIHSNTDYGENIFWGSGRNWSPADAVADWAAEKKWYNYKTNTCQRNEECLHYTQMVWKHSAYLGCAQVPCNNGDTFITCNYDPHGNVLGQKPF